MHEGPHRISKMPNNVALQPGMIVTNEPGYYKTGAYGIRIENLVAVREAEDRGRRPPLLEFETLTLAPIDLACIEPGLLDRGRAAVAQRLSRAACARRWRRRSTRRRETWLVEATRAI